MQRTSFSVDKDVAVLSRHTVYQGFTRLDVLSLNHRLFAGGMSPVLRRELVVKPEAVGVLVYDPLLDAVLLVEQFRVGALADNHPWQLEIVAGLMDGDGETLETVARREVQEEAGVSLMRLERVMSFLLSPGGSNERFTLFAGQADLAQAGGVHGLPSEGEDIRVVVLAADEVAGMLAAGHIGNAPALIALQWLVANKMHLQQRWRS